MAITLFVQYRDCPICEAPEAVTIPTVTANFFRCEECHQAVKLDAEGHLTPWLDVYSAGRKQAENLRKK